MKKRWISLYVENDIGMLAKISGLFSSKSYNLESLTVGKTEDETVSRITIGLTSNDMIFEQIKKQLNRCVGIIKVVDFTNMPIYIKEILFVKVSSCTNQEKMEVFRIAQVFKIDIVDYNKNNFLLRCVETEDKNNEVVKMFKDNFGDKVKVVRGGSVAIESVSSFDK